MKITPISVEDKKFRDLVHYVCAHGGTSLGATKLNKILWLLDTASYIEKGSPITASKYVRRDKGPVPKQILQTLSSLEAEGRIAISRSQVGPYKKRDFLSLVEPDTTRITKDEMETAQFFINYVCEHHTTASISEFTHDIVWESAQDGEEIPLEATLASEAAEITQKHIDWADSIISKLSA
jgi:hypothetical protein